MTAPVKSIRVTIQAREITSFSAIFGKQLCKKTISIQSTYIPKDQNYDALIEKMSSIFAEILKAILNVDAGSNKMEVTRKPCEFSLTFHLLPEADLEQTKESIQSILQKHFQIVQPKQPLPSPLFLEKNRSP